MTGSLPLPTKSPTDPAQLPATERDYYRATWRFDPVGDCRSLGGGWHRYEACLPLAQDPLLHEAGVTICARVDWQGETIHNRIVFRQGGAGGREAAVECTHTLVHAGPVASIPTFATDAYTTGARLSKIDREWLARAGGPVSLPPWEHFAALKSYVGAIAEVGIMAMFRATLPTKEETSRDPGGMPDLQDTPEAPFGFNSAMQAQILRALAAVAPAYTEGLRRDLARELLDTAPAAWVIKRWELLAPVYPLRETFVADPDFFVECLGAWVGEDPSCSLPWSMVNELGRPQTEESAIFPTFSDIERRMNADILLQEWERIVQAWPAELLVSVFRGGALLDGVQKYLFDNSAHLADAKTKAPTIPWDQLRLEWQARQAAMDFVDDLKERLLNGDQDGIDPKFKDFPPAEVWPRVKCYTSEYPQIFRDRQRELGTSPGGRQARVQRFLEEVIQHYNSPENNWDEDLGYVADWARRSRENVSQMLAQPFPTNLNNSFPRRPRDEESLHQWALHRGAIQRRAAAGSPDLPQNCQEKLAAHWDFATRLALAANPGVAPPVLDALARDVQPCVRALVQARQRRRSTIIAPQVGEVLSPGEILWLLIANPRTWFFFGKTTYGDGRPEYARRVEAHFTTRAQGAKQVIGELFAWAYAEGGFFHCRAQDSRGYYVSHLALQGPAPDVCRDLPCILIKIGAVLGPAGHPFNDIYSPSPPGRPTNSKKI